MPVIAAGGITTGGDLRQVMQVGAAGAVFGTRFMATKESDAHNQYKECLVAAGADSTVYTSCFNSDWEAPHRVLRNTTYEQWEAAGCPLAGHRPGESDVVAIHEQLGPVWRYSIATPTNRFKGDVDQMAMYAGTGVESISDIPSTEELIVRLLKEFRKSKPSFWRR